MVKSVRDVEWEVTDSELEALLLESRLIKERQPAYNRAQTKYVNRPFIRIDTTHDFPRVSISAFLHDDGCEYYGPMAGRREAAFVVDVIDRFFKLRECDEQTFSNGKRCAYASMGRCLAPCEATENESHYEAELNRVRAFLSGFDDSVTERIEAAMKGAAAELDFEQAGTYRDWLRALKRMLGKREAVASRVLHHNAVIIHRPDPERPVRLLIVSRGRHAETLHVDTPPEPSQLSALEQCIVRRFQEPDRSIESYREKEIDEIHVLSNWLFVHRDDVCQIRWDETATVRGMMRRISAELESAGASVLPPPSTGAYA